MFDKQPIEDAKVFMLRYVPHNWSDKYSIKLLRRLREAATPDTVIVLMEHIQDYLCRDASIVGAVPGAYKPMAPEPLLPYPDTAIGFGYLLDMAVSCQATLLSKKTNTDHRRDRCWVNSTAWSARSASSLTSCGAPVGSWKESTALSHLFPNR